MNIDGKRAFGIPLQEVKQVNSNPKNHTLTVELHVGDLDLQKGSHVLSEIVFFAGID